MCIAVLLSAHITHCWPCCLGSGLHPDGAFSSILFFEKILQRKDDIVHQTHPAVLQINGEHTGCWGKVLLTGAKCCSQEQRCFVIKAERIRGINPVAAPRADP